MSDGGTVWVEDPNILNRNSQQTSKRKREEITVPGVIQEYGKFAYLEGERFIRGNLLYHTLCFVLLLARCRCKINNREQARARAYSTLCHGTLMD